MPKYRNRIKGFRTVNARDIRINEQNWRRHGEQQEKKLIDILEDVGLVDVLKCVETDDGELVLVDGHLRREVIGNGTVQVAILDLDELEQKKVLAAFDKIGGLADTDEQALNALLEDIATSVAPLVEETDIADVLDAVAETPEHYERDHGKAQAVANTAARLLHDIAETDPSALAGAQAVIVPHEGSQVLVISDPDLSDIVRELKERHEAGETHLLDKLFAQIWEKPNAEGA